MIKFVFLPFVMSFVLLPSAWAAAGKSGGSEIIHQLHFFYGQNSISPTEVNDQLESEGLKKFTKMNQFGIQATRNMMPYLDLGLRLSLTTATTNPSDPTSSSGYRSNLTQSKGYLLLNSSPINTETFKLGVFGGAGAGNTALSVKTATEDGSYNQGTTLLAMAGASVAFGKKYVFLKIEGGYEYNSASDLTKSGTTSTKITKIDMSGPYFNVGILIDGLELGRF